MTSSIEGAFTFACCLAFLVMYCGVLVPATTSSPWALINY